ncbi:MAG TPA: alpha/beta hydrolase [Vicinamibacterales bacterium]|nr:alpha/beta hydrolase [Vicinamibacterales bacterium]
MDRSHIWFPLATAAAIAAAALALAAPALAQPRRLVQDPALDNLRHAPGTETVAPGTLGRVRKVGDGPRVMLLIPGIGFGDNVWDEFIERHRAEATMYAVTLPGFGGTRPLAMPDDPAAFGDTPWIRSAVSGILALLDKERLARVTVVAHWALASQIALQLALDRPDRVDAVVLVAGVLRSYYDGMPDMGSWTAEARSKAIDGLGTKWFKTVTRDTWDDNNFMSYDYAVNPRRGLFLWREAQAPSLPVWIRYLLEFYSTNLGPRLAGLQTPTLVVQPGFDDPGMYVEDGRNYMRNLCADSWRGVSGPPLEFATIPGSRLFVMHDKPAELDQVVAAFLRKQAAAGR